MSATVQTNLVNGAAHAVTPQQAASRVRTATAADEPEILRLLHLMHQEGGLLPLDEAHARAMFARAFNRRGGIIGVIGPPDAIEGMIYLLLTRFWYTGADHLEELFNYVRPDCRKSGHAGTLISFAKTCADEIGIPLAIGVLTNHRMVEKVRLYRRYLGAPAGAFFVYNASWVNEADENADIWKTVLREGRRPLREIAPGSRVIAPDVLEKIGGGDAQLGRREIDLFIQSRLRRAQRNGTEKRP